MPATDPEYDPEAGYQDVGLAELQYVLGQQLDARIAELQRKQALLRALARRITPSVTQAATSLYAGLSSTLAGAVFGAEDFSD